MPKARKYPAGLTHAELQRAIRIAEPERYLEQRRQWREANRDKARKSAREWYARNKDRMREKLRAVWKANRARRRKLAPGTVRGSDILEILAMQAGRCAVCRSSVGHIYHADHITPIALGGLNERRNIQILCPACNMSKGAKDPATFMRSRGFLL